MTLKTHYEWDEVEALLGVGTDSTVDDVSVANDGRLLDSAQAVRDFFDELRSTREAREPAS